jgi:alkaline phosphatase D
MDRRSFVTGAAAGGLTLIAGTDVTSAARRARRKRIVRGGAFLHGVAAGAPGEREVLLWTRLSELERTSRVRLEVARDADFRNVVERRTVEAVRWRDFTARQRVTRGLEPGREYFYRWETATAQSPVGRFRTALPADSQEPVRVGFFSCQDYQAGYYTALAGLAAEKDLDLVVCLGDYIYERTFYSGPADRRDTTGVNRDGDVQTLPEYRQKYALYHADPNLQALRAAHPLVAAWDDHEIEDNWAADQPGEATPEAERRVAFAQRKRAGQLAFFEWMPRLRSREELMRVYGSVRLGANAELFLLDTRSYRDDQPCGDEIIVPCPEAEDRQATLLGDAQKAWLEQAVPASRATWKIVGTQVMAMAFDSAPGQTVNVDGWDGYGRERREVLEALRGAGTKNLTFITGDVHTFFAGTVHVNGRITTPAVGTEFVGGSITSLGFESYFGPTTPVTQEAVRGTARTTPSRTGWSAATACSRRAATSSWSPTVRPPRWRSPEPRCATSPASGWRPDRRRSSACSPPVRRQAGEQLPRPSRVG